MSQPDLNGYVSLETSDQSFIEQLPKENTSGNKHSIISHIPMTISELMSMDLPEPNWLIPGIISMGLTSISGRPKVGKSNLCLQLASAKATGGFFLGRKLEKGRVLYIDLENSPIRMQKRAQKMGISTEVDLHFVFSWPLLDKEGIEALKVEIERGKWDLIVIDTLSRVLSIRADQMEMGSMSEIFGKLQTLAMSHNMSIIVIDHHRKKKGDSNNPVEDLFGSTGKSAPLDTIIGLYKQRGIFTLVIVGRDIEDEEVQLQWVPDTLNWFIRGEGTQSQSLSRKERIFKAINELLDKGGLPTITNVADYLGLDKSNVSSDIRELVAEGKVIAGEKQGRNLPYYPVDRQPIKALAAE